MRKVTESERSILIGALGERLKVLDRTRGGNTETRNERDTEREQTASLVLLIGNDQGAILDDPNEYDCPAHGRMCVDAYCAVREGDG